MSRQEQKRNDLQIQDRNYVYLHVDPETQEVVYVGLGTGSRAWDVKTRETGNQDHYLWLQQQLDIGYLPCDWVVIEYAKLSRKDAHERELQMIHEMGPRFNSNASWAASKYTPDQVREWVALRKEKKTYKEIAQLTGAPEMVIMRALKRTTAAYRSIVNGQ